MARYILQCSCDSFEFEFDYDKNKFVCEECGKMYTTHAAGDNLLEEED